MSLHTLKLVQNNATLFDFTDLTKAGLLSWSPDTYPSEAFSKDTLVFHLRGTSVEDLFANLENLNRVLLAAMDNEARGRMGLPYTPIWLQFQEATASYLVQSEVFGDKLEKYANVLDRDAIHGNRIQNISFTLRRRPYFEETAAVALAGSPFSGNNNGALLDIAAADVRGDLPAPLKIKLRAGAAHAGMIAALRSPASGTVANFLSQIEAESYSDKGTGVADLSDAGLSPGGGGVTGIKWTPTVLTEQMLARYKISSNVADQLGPVRVLVACRDNFATPNIAIRVKPFAYSGSTYQYGDWGAALKYVPTVATRALVDCGILQAGGADSSGLAPAGIGLEIWGKALAKTGTTPTMDLDCLYLLPAYDGGKESGYMHAIFPATLGASAAPDGVLDGNDRVPSAYLVDGSSNLTLSANTLRGDPLLAYPSRAAKLIVLLYSSASGAHVYTLTNTVTVTYTPRYRLARDIVPFGFESAEVGDVSDTIVAVTFTDAVSA